MNTPLNVQPPMIPFTQYVDKGTEYYEARYREQQIRSLAKRAQKLGLQLVIPKTA